MAWHEDLVDDDDVVGFTLTAEESKKPDPQMRNIAPNHGIDFGNIVWTSNGANKTRSET